MNAILSPTAAPVPARWIPAFDWLRSYDKTWLTGDVVAGITLAAYLLLGDWVMHLWPTRWRHFKKGQLSETSQANLKIKLQTKSITARRTGATAVLTNHETKERKQVMKPSTIQNLALAGCIIGLLAGCASTEVSNRERLVYEKLPRPNQILVYNFASSPSDVPADSEFAGPGSMPTTPPTDEEATLGRELGAGIAAQLVTEIHEMGLPAMQVSAPMTPQVNDIVIRGYLVSVDEGSTAKRMTIGFGSGGSEMSTAIEGYQMTASGLRKLGSGTLGSKGSKGPGMAVGGATWLITGSPIGLIVGGGLKVYGEASGNSKIEGRAKATAKEIADQLKKRFEEEGWIN